MGRERVAGRRGGGVTSSTSWFPRRAHACSPGGRVTEYELPVVEMVRPRWGNPATPGHLPPVAEQALAALGVTGPRPAVDRAEIGLPARALSDDDLSALVGVVGAEHVDPGDEVRLQ